MGLTTEQQMLVEQRLNNDKKSAAVAYALWFFLSGFGAHRFYLGKTGSAIAQLILFWGGWILSIVAVGFILLLVWLIWVIVDAFLIPGMVANDLAEKRTRISTDLELMSRPT